MEVSHDLEVPEPTTASTPLAVDPPVSEPTKSANLELPPETENSEAESRTTPEPVSPPSAPVRNYPTQTRHPVDRFEPSWK